MVVKIAKLVFWIYVLLFTVLCADFSTAEDEGTSSDSDESSEEPGGKPGDGYVVGILPALLFIPTGTISTIGKWVKSVLGILANGGSFKDLVESVPTLLTGLEDTVDTGVDELTDTVEEPITSVGLDELPEDLGLT